MAYGPLSSQSTFAPTSSVTPTQPAILSHVDGSQIGQMLVTVSVPPTNPDVSEMALFYSLLPMDDFTTDELFQLVATNENAYKVQRTSVPAAATQVVFTVEQLAPGVNYNWRAAAGN